MAYLQVSPEARERLLDIAGAVLVDPIAEAQLHVLEGPGHYPQVEVPRRTAALIQSLLI
jgi:pimeloyl-ACP methyl ester carboxylesterase